MVDHTLKTYQITDSQGKNPIGIIVLEFPSTLDERYSNRIANKVADVIGDPSALNDENWTYDDLFKAAELYLSQHSQMGFKLHFFRWGGCDWSFNS